MAKSSTQEQITQQQDQPDEPESPIPFYPTTQVEFKIDEITFRRHSQEHLTNTKSICLSSGILLKLLRTPKHGSQLPQGYPRRGIVGRLGTKEPSKRVFFLLGGVADGPNNSMSRREDRWEHTMEGYGNDESKIEAAKGVSSSKGGTRSPTSHSKKKKQSSLAKDTKPCQRPASTPVVARLHKEAQQATGGPTSLGVTNEERANPQLSRTNPSVLVDKTKFAGDGLKTAHNESCINKDSSNAEKEVSNDSSEFNTSLEFTCSNETTKEIKLEDLSKLVPNVKKNYIAEKVHVEHHKETKDALASQPPSLKLIKIQELSTQLLLLQTLNHKVVKEKEEAETEATLLKSKPSFPNWELPTEFLTVPSQVSSIQAKIMTWDALPSLLSKAKLALILPQSEGEPIKKKTLKETEREESEANSETKVRPTSSMVESSKKNKLNKFDFVTKEAKKEKVVGKEDLIDLLGIDVVTNVYKAKIKYDKYYDKMLNRRVQSRIINCDVLTKKGSITLKVYRDDGTDEAISNFKTSNFHLRELDPLDKLNELSKKKRKHADAFQDYFMSIKMYKSSVQYADHPAEIVLNEPCLGMMMFNSHQRHDFVTIEDSRDLINEMLYTMQEILFRIHQGPGLNDHARNFSSFLLAEVDKRNLNSLKQIRAIKQLRQ
ncbi:hypothetical protein Tco_1301951 [Tanacetum coccineum]